MSSLVKINQIFLVFTILLVFLLFALLLFALYLYVLAIAPSRFPSIRNKRICLLIAHPDDEAMFFAPTLLSLTHREKKNHVRILCLSSGDAEGLGETRKKELVKSALLLGLKSEGDVSVLDNPADFPDSMKTPWDTEKISSVLRTAFMPDISVSNAASNCSSTSAEANIDVLITFDSCGVSSHPNHVSLYRGARAFVSSLAQKNPDRLPSVGMYTLTSVNFFRKYAGLFDVFATLASTALAVCWRGPSTKGGGKTDVDGKTRRRPVGLVFVHGAGSGGWATAREAMTGAHVSQMRWFRYGWITLSRYMVMNDLRLEKV